LTEYDPKRGVSVTTLAHEYPSGYRVPEHAHRSDQLIYATSGMMEVSSGQSLWSMRTLYWRPGLVARAKPSVAVLHVTPLLRELILEAVRIDQLRIRNRYECALRDLLIPQLEKATPMPTFMTLPQEERALAVAREILKNPAESKTMAALCAEVGVSVRTIERAFRKEVGIDFESWRRQVRLTKAVELLVSGCSVKETAFEIGYCQPSAFVEMFRRTFGTTPKAWTSALRVQRSIESKASLSSENPNSHA
jgi:AraC-like DNA-binding protein